MHGCAPFQQEVRFVRRTLQEQIKFFSDQGFLLTLADAPLDLHQVFAAPLDFTLWEFVSNSKGAGAFLIGVAECSHPIDFSPCYEVAKFFELFFRFPRKTNYER